MKLGLKEIAACAALACAPIEGCKSDTDITTQPPKKNWITETSAECNRRATEVANNTEIIGSPSLWAAARQSARDEALRTCLQEARL